MADSPPFTNPTETTLADDGPPPSTPPSMPLWVKAFGIVAIVLVLLFVGMHLTGMGPGGHMMRSHTMPAGATDHGGTQP
jgi:hypothetical protein